MMGRTIVATRARMCLSGIRSTAMGLSSTRTWLSAVNRTASCACGDKAVSRTAQDEWGSPSPQRGRG